MSNDVTSILTKSRRYKFQNKLREMEEVVATRTSAVDQLVTIFQELIETLKCVPKKRELAYRFMNNVVK